MKVTLVSMWLAVLSPPSYASDGSLQLDREVLFELLRKASIQDNNPVLAVRELEGVLGQPTRHDPVGGSSNMPVSVYMVSSEGELQVTSGNGNVYSAIIVLKDGSRQLVWK